MTDPEKTDTNWKLKYAKVEAGFDDVLGVVLRSPFTFGAFIIWTLGALIFGWWVGRP